MQNSKIRLFWVNKANMFFCEKSPFWGIAHVSIAVEICSAIGSARKRVPMGEKDLLVIAGFFIGG